MTKQPSMTEMWDLLQAQRALAESQRMTIEEQQVRIAALEGRAGPSREQGDRHSAGSSLDRPGRLTRKRLSRGSLLKAAAAGAAGLIAVDQITGAGTAQANDGDNLQLGENNGNYAQSLTSLSPSSWINDGFPMFEVVDYGESFRAIANGGTISPMIFGTATGTVNFDAGVAGAVSSGGIGVSGRAEYFGVMGESTGQGSNNNIGVYGFDSSSYGWGVVGRSLNGTDPGSPGYGVGVMGESGSTGTGVAGNGYNGGTGVAGQSDRVGVRGTSTGQGSDANIGVYGIASSGYGWGVVGRSLDGTSPSTFGEGLGVLGESGASGTGVWGNGYGGGTGVQGQAVDGGIGVGGQSSDIGVQGESTGNGSQQNIGVYGFDSSGYGWGVVGRSLSQSNYGLGLGVLGESGGAGIGVSGNGHQSGTGVQGQSFGAGAGVLGLSTSGPAIQARSTSGPGVQATSAKGRGVVTSSNIAQLRLYPSTATTHPAKGLAGDLFVDKSHRLWFCRGGSAWVELA
ncbi:MAG TPA: hypothetical protein VFB34_12715 [Chloroflexota bacterium]|nr:hypothetical protein [Chloroflexota bacterium]